MTRSKHPQEGGLFPAVQAELTELRSIAEVEILEGLGCDPERRTNIAIYAGQIGVALADTPREKVTTDSALNVYPDDFRRARLERLSSGLYVPKGSELYRTADRLITIGYAPCTLEAQGVVDRDVGVVVGPDEYDRYMRSAWGVALHSRTTTRDARDQDKVREETIRATKSSAVQTMDNYIMSMKKLEGEFIIKADLFWSMYRDARSVWHAGHRTKNLEVKRRQVDEMIHEIAEIAIGTLNYGTTKAKATHNVIASNLYRRGSAKELAESWRAYTIWGYEYMNAKRGKVDQSTNACEMEKALNAQGMAAKV